MYKYLDNKFVIIIMTMEIINLIHFINDKVAQKIREIIYIYLFFVIFSIYLCNFLIIITIIFE